MLNPRVMYTYITAVSVIHVCVSCANSKIHISHMKTQLAFVYLHFYVKHVLYCSRDALMLVDDLHNALVELEGEEGVPVVPVELVNPNVAKIFSKSPRAKVFYVPAYIYIVVVIHVSNNCSKGWEISYMCIYC